MWRKETMTRRVFISTRRSTLQAMRWIQRAIEPILIIEEIKAGAKERQRRVGVPRPRSEPS